MGFSARCSRVWTQNRNLKYHPSVYFHKFKVLGSPLSVLKLRVPNKITPKNNVCMFFAQATPAPSTNILYLYSESHSFIIELFLKYLSTVRIKKYWQHQVCLELSQKDIIHSINGCDAQKIGGVTYFFCYISHPSTTPLLESFLTPSLGQI